MKREYCSDGSGRVSISGTGDWRSRAAGADRVEVADPTDVPGFEKVMRSCLGEEKLAVVIARAPCKLIDRWRPPAPEQKMELCSGCLLWMKIDCPALSTTPDGKVVIDTALCAGCELCTEVCNRGALAPRPAEERRRE